MAEILDTSGLFVAIFKFWNGQFWPISADTLANFSFSYLVTLGQTYLFEAMEYQVLPTR